MNRFLKLLLSDRDFKILLIVAFASLILFSLSTDYWLAIGVPVIIALVGKLWVIFTKYLQYKNIDGEYTPYSYEDIDIEFISEDGEKFIMRKEGGHTSKLNEMSNGEASLRYLGANLFEIEIRQNDSRKSIWKGKMWFNDILMADIVWSYISPPSLQNACGFKKAVVLQGNPLRVFLFSPDNQGYGREVLFKRG